MHNEVLTETINSTILNESFSIAFLHTSAFTTGKLYRPDHNSILFITKGTITVLVDNEIFTLSANSLLLVAKGQIYSFVNNDAEGYLLKFGNCFWDKTPISASNCKAVVFDSANTTRIFSLSADNKTELKLLFDALLEDYESPYYSNKPDALAAYLKIIIIKIANIYTLLKEHTASYDTKIYQQFSQLAEQNFRQLHHVSDYANKLNISSRKLQEACKATGSGAKETINEQLITEAKRLLQFTSLPIKEIAAQLGFATPYHFSSFFKKQTTTSPAAYKQVYVQNGI